MRGILLALLVMAMRQGAVPPNAPPNAPQIRSIDKGTMSGLSAARQVTVSDRDAWAALWREHAPARPLPEVDFSREVVVGIFLGTRSSAGFTVEIVGRREDGERTIVQYRETTPPPGSITAQVIVSPYHLAALPKRAGAITFEKLI
jgi:hypothetical protein